ncbi:DinB family protein [Chitinophagaceae bacterium MMS25-I14]
MFRKLEDFFNTWAYESEATLKIFNSLTDASLQQAVYTEGRTLARLANHIIQTLTEMPHNAGLPVEEQNPSFTTVAELTAAYAKASEAMMAAVKAAWTDESLDESRNMYGEEWKNGATLFILITHQTHHRGQMTVLMRQAGLKVPGVYGPSKEEWAAYNMPAMA